MASFSHFHLPKVACGSSPHFQEPRRLPFIKRTNQTTAPELAFEEAPRLKSV